MSTDPMVAILAAAKRATLLAAEHLLAESNKAVPHEQGDLERSGAAVSTGPLTAQVSYSSPYAVLQHEDLTYKHDDGRHAKFLERAMLREQKTITAIIANELRKALT